MLFDFILYFTWTSLS